MGNQYDYRQLREFINANHDRFSELNFDSSMSMQQKMNGLVEWFKVMLKEYNDWIEYLDEFKETFDSKLYSTTDDILNKWLEDGLLTEFIRLLVNEEVKQARTSINGFVYPKLKNRIDKIEAYEDEINKKSDKVYVDNMLASIAQGGPRELFYSLAALKAKYPNGADGTYLVFDSATTDGAHSYMWDVGSKSWKDLGIYQAQKIAAKTVRTGHILEKSIRPSQTDFLVEGSNIIDLDRMLTDVVIDDSGNQTTNSQYNTVIALSIKPNTTYISKGALFISIYNADLQLSRRISTGSSTDSVSFSTTSEETMVSFSFFKSQTNSVQANEGTKLLPYEAYKKLANVDLAVRPTELPNNGISDVKVDFIKNTSNMANSENKLVGHVIDSTGNLTNNDSYIVETNFIEVEANTSYYQVGYPYAAQYDKNKNFISRLTGANNAAGSAYLTDGRTKYLVLCSVASSNGNYHLRRLTLGDTLVPHEPEGGMLSERIIVSRLKNGAIKRGNTSDNSIDKDSLTVVENQTNLFDESNLEYGSVVSETTGDLTTNLTYNSTMMIPVKEGQSLDFKGFLFYALYNDNGDFIKRVGVSPSPYEATYVVEEGVKFIRGSYQWNTSFIKSIVVSGTETPSFGNKFIKGSGFEPLNEVIENNVDRYFCDTDISGFFKTNETYPDFTNFTQIKHDVVNQYFLDLETANKDYISHEILGEDLFGNDVYMFRAKHELPDSDLATKRMKMVFICGTHGYEHASSIVTYLMLKQICEKWQEYPLLEAIKYNLELLIIPVLNPSGWDDYTRKNRNGVDPARNYPVWFTRGSDPSHNQYGGAEPFSERESQMVRDMLERERGIDALYDFHNFSESDNGTNFVWILNSNLAKLANMARTTISKLSRHYKSKYDFITVDSVGYTSNQKAPMVGEYAHRIKGIKLASTIEICSSWQENSSGKAMDQKVAESGVEMLVNWIIANMREFIR